MKKTVKPKLADETLVLLYGFHDKTEIEDFNKLPAVEFDIAVHNLFKVLGLKYSKKELQRLQNQNEQ